MNQSELEVLQALKQLGKFSRGEFTLVDILTQLRRESNDMAVVSMVNSLMMLKDDKLVQQPNRTCFDLTEQGLAYVNKQ